MANYIIPNVYVEDKKSTTPVLSVTSQDSVVFAGAFKKGAIGKISQINSPTVFDKSFGDEKNQPKMYDYYGGYYLSTLTSNYYVSRAFHYVENESGTPTDSDQSAFFGWERMTSEPIFKVTTPYVINLSANSKKLIKSFIANNVLTDGSTWVSRASYTLGVSSVVYEGVSYVCKKTHSGVSAFPSSDGDNWKEITNILTWENVNTYYIGNVVSHSGSNYICTTSVVKSSVSPNLDTDNWIVEDTTPSAWVYGTGYTKGDFVSYDGKLYASLTTHISTTSPSSTNSNWLEYIEGSPSAWKSFKAYSMNDLISYNNKYFICKLSNINNTAPFGGTLDYYFTEFTLPVAPTNEINFVGWEYKGEYESVSYSKYDVVHVTLGDTYFISLEDGNNSATSDTTKWKQIYPINVIQTGSTDNKGHYIFTATDTVMGSDTNLNKIQEYTQPSYLFQHQYTVAKAIKQTGTPKNTFTIILEDGFKITPEMAVCGWSINNKSDKEGFTYLSGNTLQLSVSSTVNLNIKKGDKLNLFGLIEGSDVVSKLPTIPYYDKDLNSDGLSNTDFFSNIDGVGLCKGIYSPYDQDFTANGSITNGIKVFAKSTGDWGNNISVVVIGKEYWESDLNEFSYLYPNRELSTHELIVIVFENDSIVEKFMTSINPEAENELGLKYYIDDVIFAGSTYISVKYLGGTFEETEATNQINNLYIGDGATVGKTIVTRREPSLLSHSTDESFKYKVVITQTSPSLLFDVYINDVLTFEDKTSDFIYNGYTYTVTGTSVVGNYLEWNSYHPMDASGIKIKFQLQGGVTSTSITPSDVARAYALFNTKELDGLLVMGGVHYLSSDMKTLAQSIGNDVLSKKINIFGLYNIPYTLLNNVDKAQAIADWSNIGGFNVSDTNDKYVIYDTYFNCIVKNKKVILPKNFLMVRNHLNTFKEVGRHQAVAGKQYGLIGDFDSIVWYPKTDTELEKLILASINPTMFIIRAGFYNWGQKTYLKRSYVEKDAHVVLSKILIQQDCKNLVDEFVFSVISTQTKYTIENIIKQYLNTHITKGTIEEYTVTTLDETTANTIRIKISLRFPQTAEFIVLEFETKSPNA
jgi:hypothetical protein